MRMVRMFGGRHPCFLYAGLSLLLFCLAGCGSDMSIVGNIDEKEANVILVLLESKGVSARKVRWAHAQVGTESAPKFSIVVSPGVVVKAVSILNQNGFPRNRGSDLLELFAKQGLMTSDKEETIRYHAGLGQQLTNTILMIDGVIDASVQLSFPPEEGALGSLEQNEPKKITAAVYVKHQGIVDDPNIHLENKIKRLVSGSVSGLDIGDVTVVSDRSRFTDISPEPPPSGVALSGSGRYVNIWNIVMSKDSATRFRTIFFILSAVSVLCIVALGWLAWKLYPELKRKVSLSGLFADAMARFGKRGEKGELPPPPEESDREE